MERRTVSLMDMVKIVGFIFALGMAYASMSTQLDAHVKDMESVLKISRLICQNTAKTESASARCWE